jgi:hypothetical protein
MSGTNNKYVNDLANLIISDDSTIQQRYIKLLADNRKFHCKAVGYALKYRVALKSLKSLKVKNEFEFVNSAISYISTIIKYNK